MVTETGKFVLHMGMMGSGKSTAAKGLERDLSIARICREDEMKRLYGSNIDFDNEEQKETAFRIVIGRAWPLLCAGETVVLDGLLFNRRFQLEEALGLAEDAGARVLPIYFDCPDEIAIARIEAQDHIVPDRSRERYERVKASFEPIEAPHHVVDGSKDKPLVLRDCTALVLDESSAYSARELKP